MTDFRTIDPNSDPDWDAFVETSPDGWVWGLSGWQRLIERVPEWGLKPLSFEMRENGKRVAIMPLHINPHGVAASSGWGLVGPILACDLAEEERARVLGDVLNQAEMIAARAGASTLQLGSVGVTRRNLANPDGENPYLRYGLKCSGGQTKIVSLRADKDLLWSAFSANARQEIRRAERSGCRVERVDWSEHLDRYYAIHQETYTRTGVSSHPKAYFSGLAREMSPSGHSVLWAGFASDGSSIAYHNDAALGPGSLYHTGCSTNDALKTGINYLLMWTAILGAKERGQNYFEIGEVFLDGGSQKQTGLTVFKSKFGGATHKVYKASRDLVAARSPDIRLSEDDKKVGLVPWLRRRIGAVMSR